jgi:hypothetical protein
MIIYLACPIDTSRPEISPQEQYKELADLVLEGFKDRSVVLFNPLTAFVNAHRTTDTKDWGFIIETNMQSLKNADLVVAIWNGSPSYGVPIELNECVKSLKPFVVWNRSGKALGLYLKYGIAVCGHEVTSAEDLVFYLQNVEFKERESHE